MMALGLLVTFGIFVVIAVLGMMFGVDTRPGPADPPEVLFRHCS
jgi:hypothetical protein